MYSGLQIKRDQKKNQKQKIIISKDFIYLSNQIEPFSKKSKQPIPMINVQHTQPRINDNKRKADVVNLIHQFLFRNKILETANLLKKQALIADKENVEQYIRTIKQSQNLLEQEKTHKIKTQLQKSYLREISQNNFDAALKILNEKMPQYFGESDLQRFAENLIPSVEDKQNNKKDECLLLSMFESYFIKNPFEDARLPNSRVKVFSSNKEIWFVKFSGEYLVAIDQERKGMIFSRQFEYLYEKEKMHDKMVSNVKWRNEVQFATSSESGQIKLWNYKLEQLQVFKYHKKLITSIVFFEMPNKQQQYIVSGGHDKFIVFNNITDIHNNIEKKLKLKELITKDIKYYKKRNQLIFLSQKKKQISTIKFFNPDLMKWAGEIKANEVYFQMQISQSDDILHLITHDGQIVNYSLKTHQKLGVFLGVTAKNFVIRMEKGGYMNQFLATGSESGQILIYNQRKVQPIKRLKTVQKTVVNSVAWIDPSTIVCGCDNGNIQYWIYEKQRDIRQL